MAKNVLPSKLAITGIIVREKLERGLIYFILVATSVVFLYPILYAVGVSFYWPEIFASKLPSILPLTNQPTLKNYVEILAGYSDPYMKNYIFNSVARALWYVVWTTLSSFMMGYVFSRMKFWGRNVIFFAFLVTMMLPGVITMVPKYIVMARFPLIGGNNIFGQGGSGFINKYSVLFVLGLMNVYAVFLMRMALHSMPPDMEEAARIDGAGILRIMFQIVAPIQKPMLAYVAIITSIFVWNDWWTPFIFIHSTEKQTLAGAVTRLTTLVGHSQPGAIDYPRVVAFGMFLTVPCLVLFAFFQRYIVEGLASAAVKG